MKTKKQKDAAFIEKVKTINVSTGAKKPEMCGHCGKPKHQHKIAGVLIEFDKEPTPPRDESGDCAFAA